MFGLKREGILLVVSGPSGSGKTSLCQALSGKGEVVYSVSCTTRQMREGEEDGVHYFFLSEEEFEEKAGRGEFLEHAMVHGNRYGTLKSSVLDHLRAGRDVVMDIDVQGAELVRACSDEDVRRAIVDVFVLPPDMEELRGRLSGRGTESEEEMAFRLKNALEEMEHWGKYSYTIVSGTREADLTRITAILHGERNRSSRMVAKGDASGG